MKQTGRIFGLVMAVAIAGNLLVGCAGTAAISKQAASQTAASAASQATAQDVIIAQVGGAGDIGFLEKRTGRADFDSFDEIIAQLQSGEGYAYITVAGKDNEILAVTEMTYAWDDKEGSQVSFDVDFYAPVGYMDNKIEHVGHINTGSSGNPVRIAEDGILYACNNRTYGQLQMADQDLLEYSTQITLAYDGGGNATVDGYASMDGTLDKLAKTDISTEEDFFALFNGLEDIAPVAFTVV